MLLRVYRKMFQCTVDIFLCKAFGNFFRELTCQIRVFREIFEISPAHGCSVDIHTAVTMNLGWSKILDQVVELVDIQQQLYQFQLHQVKL